MLDKPEHYALVMEVVSAVTRQMAYPGPFIEVFLTDDTEVLVGISVRVKSCNW